MTVWNWNFKKMKKIVYLPLDERPCNYSFVSMLNEGNKKIKILTPKFSDMGYRKTPANVKNIEKFLLKECKDADYLNIALDTLLYGGLLYSRLHYLSEEIVLQRLNVLSEIKRKNPKIKIYAFSLVMRCPSYSSDAEEPDYYGICGREIFLYGENEDKYYKGIIDKKEYLNNKEKLKICEPYLEDYITRRKINISVLSEVLKLKGNVIDDLYILQDDSAPYGYTAMDQATLKDKAKKLKINLNVYPGADEAGLTLYSKVLTDINGYSPKICPIYPDEACKNVIPVFEDREVYKSIKAQIESAGATVSDEKGADVYMFCNLPVGEMHNINNLYGESYDKRNIPEFTDKMLSLYKAGKSVALSDIAYGNGGDAETTEPVDKKIGLLNLSGYAGWNSSSNTLGTVIAESIFCYFYGKTKSHRRFIAERVYEDIGYCAYVREHIKEEEMESLKITFDKVDGIRGKAVDRARKFLNEYISEKYPEIFEEYKIEDAIFPWNRLFEISLKITERE